MAQQADLDRLMQGVTVWNQWREAYPAIQPNLSQADLMGADLREANFHGTNFIWTRLGGARLDEADLREADLTGADLSDTDLRKANLSLANLSMANLVGSDLREANLTTLGIDTLFRSQGLLPKPFLRGIGALPSFIASVASTFGKPALSATCLISYAHQDHLFAERLCTDLQGKEVRCWLVPKDDGMKEILPGSMDRPRHSYNQPLLVLSEHSVQSGWIEREVQTAFEQEAQVARRVLFPIKIDDAVRHATAIWATDLLQQLEDFCGWEQQERYQQALSRLCRHLQRNRMAE